MVTTRKRAANKKAGGSTTRGGKSFGASGTDANQDGVMPNASVSNAIYLPFHLSKQT